MNSVQLDYRGLRIHASRDAWFNATEIAVLFDKRLDNFWTREETREYISVLYEDSNSLKFRELKTPFNQKDYPEFIRTRRGRHNSGTWLHPDLMVLFARWLDTRFAVWCDRQIKQLLTECPQWQSARDDTKAFTRIINMTIEGTRLAEGKPVKSHHFTNEALMINEALTGKREPLNRDALTHEQLTKLSHAISTDVIAISRGIPYKARKQIVRNLIQNGEVLRLPRTMNNHLEVCA